MLVDLFEYMIEVTRKEEIFFEVIENLMRKHNKLDNNNISRNNILGKSKNQKQIKS